MKLCLSNETGGGVCETLFINEIRTGALTHTAPPLGCVDMRDGKSFRRPVVAYFQLRPITFREKIQSFKAQELFHELGQALIALGLHQRVRQRTAMVKADPAPLMDQLVAQRA